ncbi:Sec23-binding domain of Sec16-domain-containing protein [Abortiporus biennis]|nr:Sec23-binding domain of Sec16-domain-containing protein [Abortiporus biennis]
MSSSSNLSLASTSARDPYAPSLHVRQSSLKQTPYQAPSVQNRIPADSIPAGNYDRTGAQTLSVASRVMQTPYAPSPSLLGTNDPLGRTSVRVPVVSFGFGGKLVTCFHGTPSLNTGFDVALSARQSTDVQVRLLHQTIPESALDTSAASFPGPLFSDPGSPSTSIVRTGAATQAKSKKAKVIKYLEDRASEISKGISYLSSESVEGKRSESKLILVGLLKVMVENDGKLSGSSQIDAAVRAALVSQSSPTDSSSDSLHTAVALTSTSYSSLSLPIHDSTDYDIAVHTLRSSHLDKIQSLLVRGERRAAFQYAADEKLWAHAMVIASSIDKDAWKEVVAEFVRSELEDKDTVTSAPGKSIGRPSHGKEALRVAYSLFAGSGAAAVQELSPPKLLSSLQVPPPPQALSVTPMTPSFPAPTQTYPIPPHVLAKWTEAAAMMISSPMSLDTSSALTALGDQLAANNWIEAAHACYLLSPQTSPLGGVGSPSARVLLFGASNPSVAPSFWKDPDPIIFSEVVEYALSLTPSAKGQEPFTGLPHLQAYKLIRAASLAEMGHDQLANRYCDAISSSISRPSPYIHAILVGQLKLLTERLVAAPQMDKSGSWIGSKMTRPSLDKIGNWLEGRLKDFIAGDGESPVADNTQPKDRTFSGPFAHYSTISSASSSTHASPQQSMMDLAEVDTPPYRTGSAMALRPSNPAHVQINRASSAMDYIRRKASPIPRVSSASATAPTFGDATPFRNFGNTSNSQGDGSAEDSSSGPQIASWWGASESTAPTPTATSFVHLDSGVPAVASEGFISLMDDPALSVPPSAPPRTPSSFAASHSIPQSINEEDDLGLGNSTSRAQRAGDANAAVSNTPEPAKSTPELEKTADSKAAPSAGWFSRLWKRESGPVKANLGEQTSFYYDENLKRWVNKNAGAQDSKPSAPPPPPRAQTASPGTASSRMYGGPSPAPAPPTRPATTSIDLSDSPPRKPPIRVRSNLIPSETSSAPATPATATTPMNGSPMDGPPGLDGPPPPGARARAHAKKNVRSRYVDVFQQP